MGLAAKTSYKDKLRCLRTSTEAGCTWQERQAAELAVEKLEKTAKGISEGEAHPGSSSRWQDGAGGPQTSPSKAGGREHKSPDARSSAEGGSLRSAPSRNGHVPKQEPGSGASPQHGQRESLEARGSVQPSQGPVPVQYGRLLRGEDPPVLGHLDLHRFRSCRCACACMLLHARLPLVEGGQCC